MACLYVSISGSKRTFLFRIKKKLRIIYTSTQAVYRIATLGFAKIVAINKSIFKIPKSYQQEST